MRSWLLIVLAFSLFCFSAPAQTPPEKKKAKNALPKIEDAVARAVARGLKDSSEYGGFRRATCSPSNTSALGAVLVVCEFKDALGIYQAVIDPTEDQFVVVEKEKALLLDEAIGRMRPLPQEPR